MTAPLKRQDHDMISAGAGLAFDDLGLTLGPGVIAWREDGQDGQHRYRVRPAAEIARALRLAYSEHPDEVIVRCARSLQRVVDLLKDGDDARAGVQAVLARLPAISSEGLAELAVSRDSRRAGDAYLTEDRISADQTGAGEWTDGDAGDRPQQGGGEAQLSPAAFTGATPADKRAFVQNYYVAASRVAKQLNVPVENILGIAALGSSWGKSRFALDNKNLFGMEFPSPPAKTYTLAGKPKKDGTYAKVSKFETFGDSFLAFAIRYKSLVQGVSDPEKFAAILQDRASFGRDMDTGAPVKSYVADVAGTIRRLRPFVGAHRKQVA